MLLGGVAMLAGCARPNAQERSAPPRQTLTAPDGRTYELFLPSGLKARPRPLLIMLHGCLQSPGELAQGTRLDQLAQKHQVLVAYPEQSAARNPARCWNWFLPVHQEREGGEPASIAAITRAVMQRTAVDSTRVYLAGLSAGAAMAVVLSTRYPDLYSAVAVVAGVPFGAATDVPSALALLKRGDLPAPALPARPVPALFLHGSADTIVHINNFFAATRQWREAIERGGITLTMRVDTVNAGPGQRAFVRTRYFAPSLVVQTILIDSLPHLWSGGDPAARFMAAQGPDASALMMDFLLSQRRRK